MKPRILILITSYLAAARRVCLTTAASIMVVAGANVISTSATAQGVNDRYYRFAEGVAGNAATGVGSIVDSIWGSADGTPSGGPVYSSDVPMAVIPLTGETNTLSLAFNGSQSVLFNSFFLLHRGFGDATLEYFIKLPNQSHHSIFWTRPTDFDANRFNIAINSSGGCGFDYRDPSGVLHLGDAGASLFQIPVNTWTHIAVVRDAESLAPAHIYHFFVNGVEASTVSDPNPNEPDPNLMWSIAGRSGYRFTGLIDEIRLTQRALTPDEFLIATPQNTAPVATILAPPSGYLAAVGEGVSFEGSIVDDDAAGTHTAEWIISSATLPATSIQGTVSGYSVSDTIQFPEAGVYSIKLVVTDPEGAAGEATTVLNDLPAYVVVYDPEGGFVTGGGWIASPWGAFHPGDEEYAQFGGFATFGFVSKYQHGANVPTGQTEFQYHAWYMGENIPGGELNFQSSSYDWLVVAGARAQFKGEGTINGEGEYGFMVTATDSQVPGGGDVDRFRIKIWDIATEVIVYDNQAGSDDDAELNEFNFVRGGNIVIHNN
jgi:hypothetical protein